MAEATETGADHPQKVSDVPERPAAAEAAETERPSAGRKVRQGVVVGDKMDKTVVVSVERMVAHPLYGKQVSRYSRFYAHDEDDEYRTGDIVRIEETRPLSKLKRWRVIELVERPD